MWTIFGNVSYFATDTAVAVCWGLIAISQEVHIKEVALRECRWYVISWKSKPLTAFNEGALDVVGHLSCHTSTQVMVQVKGICEISSAKFELKN